MTEPRYHEDGLTLYCGDARDVLATLPADGIDCVVTSPPYYGLRNYDADAGGTWRGGDIECEHESTKRPTRFERDGLSEKQASNSGSDGDESALRSMVCDCGAVFVPSGAVWGGDPACAHEWTEMRVYKDSPTRGGGEGVGFDDAEKTRNQRWTTSNRCSLCGAWRGALGREPTPELYVEHIVEIFRCVARVLKPTGTVWLNLGDSFAGSGRGPTGHNGIGNQAARQGFHSPTRTAIDGLKSKDLIGIPWRVAFALQADGWYLRRDIVWNKPNPMPESVTDRPTSTHEYIFLLTKSPKYFYDAFAVREPSQSGPSDRRKMAEQRDRIGGKTLDATDADYKANMNTNIGKKRGVGDPAGRNARSVWTIATTPSKLPHFAAFPEKLVEPCIKAGTSEHGACADCGQPYTRVVKRVAGVSTMGPKTQAAHEARGGTGTPVGTVGKSGSGRTDGSVESVGFEHAVEPENLRNRNNGTAKFDFHARQVGAGQKLQDWMDENPQTTVGWTGCADAPVVPCVVLDPFVGTGSALKVARDLGRHAIGIDVSEQYVELAMHRLRYGERGALAIRKGQMELSNEP